MKRVLVLAAAALALTACSSTGSNVVLPANDYGSGIKPIPGSITYGDAGARRSPLPPGRKFTHEFYGQFGEVITERYRVKEDGTLDLFSRRVTSITVSR